jgi:hypothetical protein
MSEESELDKAIRDAVEKANKGFEEVVEDAEEATRMSYDSQCAREIIRAWGETSEEAKTILKAVRKAGEPFSLATIRSHYPNLPVQMGVSPDAMKRPLEVAEVLQKGVNAPIVKAFHRAMRAFGTRNATPAIFMRTVDAGNVVFHGLVWAGDVTQRTTVPRFFVPGGEPGKFWLIEARKSFIYLLRDLVT